MSLSPDEPPKPLTAESTEEWLWRLQKKDTTQRYHFHRATFSLLQETSAAASKIGAEILAQSKMIQAQARRLRLLSEQLRRH